MFLFSLFSPSQIPLGDRFPSPEGCPPPTWKIEEEGGVGFFLPLDSTNPQRPIFLLSRRDDSRPLFFFSPKGEVFPFSFSFFSSYLVLFDRLSLIYVDRKDMGGGWPSSFLRIANREYIYFPLLSFFFSFSFFPPNHSLQEDIRPRFFPPRSCGRSRSPCPLLCLFSSKDKDQIFPYLPFPP